MNCRSAEWSKSLETASSCHLAIMEPSNWIANQFCSSPWPAGYIYVAAVKMGVNTGHRYRPRA